MELYHYKRYAHPAEGNWWLGIVFVKGGIDDVKQRSFGLLTIVINTGSTYDKIDCLSEDREFRFKRLGDHLGLWEASLGSLGGLLELFGSILGRFLGASWRSFADFGWKVGVGHRFVLFPFSRKAVLKRLGIIFWLLGGHLDVILEVFHAIACTASRTCKIDVLPAFCALWADFSGFSDTRKHCILQYF